ncbi:ParA family protein [Campylobacter helveticus]|uniref:ParA family protein n=1 Tax=Campylobacter helveticus TaxID=28898 RepID=UPI00104DC59B|nr:ParA family protein [Campylobacter helveticus]QBL12688.1 ParA family protein [Campylobacter helveticus]
MAIISFSHPKGGVGKTTICFNYLVHLQDKKKKFICIDLDGQSSISNLNQLRVLNKLRGFDIKKFKDERELINFINKNDDDTIIVIDSGGFDSAFNRIVLSVSDLVITPFSDSPLEILRLIDFDKNILNQIEEQSKQKLKIHLLINRISSSIKQFDYIYKQMENCSHYTFLKNLIRDKVIFKNSLTEGKGILEIETKNSSEIKAQKELKKLFKEIDNLLN